VRDPLDTKGVDFFGTQPYFDPYKFLETFTLVKTIQTSIHKGYSFKTMHNTYLTHKKKKKKITV
jgi:5,10-methylenetetrahydrofolate reductase